MLGIAAVKCPLESHTRIDPHLFITEDDAWLHVVDDWTYTLWHTHVIEVLHKQLPGAEVFACSIGDCDDSFDFRYYSSGRLLRKFVVDDPSFNRQKRKVTIDEGDPLLGEQALDKIESDQEYVLSLAKNVGVNIRHDLSAVRSYVYQPDQCSKPVKDWLRRWWK